MSPAGPAADPDAPYVRLAVVGVIRRTGMGGPGAGEAPDGTSAPVAGSLPGEARWLLLHRTRPFEAWDPPGGRMEDGENLVQAVTREVMEETGLAVQVAGPCYAFLTFYQGERLLAVSMACRSAGDPDAIRLEHDGAEAWRWATSQQWEALAAARLSSWEPTDVKKATAMVAAIWEAEER